MKSAQSSFKSFDGKSIHYYKWSPQTESVKAVVQIAHGMAEHAGRYERFAKFLAENGYIVFANDHRGHGKTAGSENELGFMEDGSFWEKAIGDMYELNKLAKSQYPNLPCFLIGHSMGSLLSRDYISRYGNELSGVVLSATGGDPGVLGKIGLFIAKTEALFKGRKKKSTLLNALSFGKFNQPFKPIRTQFDWLSRDEEEVDKYISDPLCGTVFNTGFFIDLITGVNKINAVQTFQSTPKTIPILLAAGDQDPVGEMGKGVKEVHEKYKNAGIIKMGLKLYENARHEILNETNRDEVQNDLLNWMEGIILDK